MQPPASDFLKAEYTALREEIQNRVKQMETNERLALVAAGGIWSWLATHPWQPAFLPFLYAPALIALLLAVKWLAIEKGIRLVAKYLQSIEAVWAPEGRGWERFLTQQGRGWFMPYHVAFWSALILLNTALALWIQFHPPA